MIKKIIISVVVLVLVVTAGILFFYKKSQKPLNSQEQEIMKHLENKKFHKPVDLPIADQEKLKSSCNDFFSAIQHYDLNELASIIDSRPEWRSYYPKAKELKNHYSDITEITIGEPFKVDSNLYPGVYIPYKIRFKNGNIEEGRVAIKYRYDNEKISWFFDGI